MKCQIHDDRNAAGQCSCSEIVAAVRLILGATESVLAEILDLPVPTDHDGSLFSQLHPEHTRLETKGCLYCERVDCDTDCYHADRFGKTKRPTAREWREIGKNAVPTDHDGGLGYDLRVRAESALAAIRGEPVTKKDAIYDLRVNVDSVISGLYDLRRDSNRDLVLERAISLADSLAAKVKTIAARGHERDDSFSDGRMEIVVDNRKRDFVFRPDSVGDTGVIEQIFERKDYDLSRFALSAVFERYVEGIRTSGRRPLIIDAGANIGASPIYFLSQYPDAAIVAIEPERRNCDLLRTNCAGLDVRVIEAALDSHPGSRFLNDPGRSDWGFRISDQGSTPQPTKSLYEVATVSVPQILQDYSSSDYAPTIFKIDIEGGEKDLFSGEVGWLATMPLVIIELHDWMLPSEATARNFLRAISSFDFDVIHAGENTFCFNNALLRSVEHQQWEE